MKLQAFAILIALLVHTEAARILSIIPTFTKSHAAAARPILMELVKRGHEVVSISPFEEKHESKKFKWIPIEVTSIFDAMPDMEDEFSKDMDFFESQLRLWSLINGYTKYITAKPKLKDFIENDNSHFDLVIAEEFYTESFYTFAHKYKAPLILLCTFGNGHYINEYMGNSFEFSYVPHEFIDFFGDLSLFDKIKNLIYSIGDIVLRKYYSVEVQNELAKEIFHNTPNKPHVAELERNASLILLNSHFTLSVVRPYLPNMIEIGGVHMGEVKPLPQEFKGIMDKSKNGVVLFSLGSVMDLSAHNDEFAIEVLNSLGNLKYDVIVVWRADRPLPARHSNIYPSKWVPQNDLLAHPNMKAFVTHGGLHSSIESINHGVPIVCIPFFGDQKYNCKKSEYMGFGIYLDRSGISKIHESVTKLLGESKYKTTAVELSNRFKDRPVSVLDNTVFWIEYVIRHKGANFIKSPKRNLSWYEHTYLDVFGLLLAVTVVTVLVIKKILNLVFRGKSNKKVKKN